MATGFPPLVPGILTAERRRYAWTEVRIAHGYKRRSLPGVCSSEATRCTPLTGNVPFATGICQKHHRIGYCGNPYGRSLAVQQSSLTLWADLKLSRRLAPAADVCI
ncbi:hypothetical protein GCM10009753_17390 [Streptantibioticus ferralitis]